MTFFKLPSLFSRHKKSDADNLENLFMLPEQQRSSPVSEKNIFVSASPQRNSFQPREEKQKISTIPAHPFKTDPPEAPMQKASDKTADSIVLTAQTEEMTKSFQTQQQRILQDDIVSFQDDKSAPPPESHGQETYFSTAKYTKNSAEKKYVSSVPSKSSGRMTEFSHFSEANPASKETPFEHVPPDSGNRTDNGNFLQMNSNLNTLANYAKNQLRYLKKNCELLQNQNRNQTFN